MDKPKQFAVPSSKNIKTKRPSTVTVASTSSRGSRFSANSLKTTTQSRSKLNSTAVDPDVSVMRKDVANMAGDFEEETRQIAYGKFLRAMLEDCLLNDKIEREETEIDIQMAQLADRFKKTMDQLDKTNRRLKDINFVVEQKRLLNLKSSDSTQFYNITEESNAQKIMQDLNKTEETYLDRLETKNVDFGYDKTSGHSQLLDAVNDAIDGLEKIKKHSKLDIEKFKEYEKSQKYLEKLEKTKLELNCVKTEFESKYPSISEKLIKEVSDKIAGMFDDEED